MNAPNRFVRRATPVEAMRIQTMEDAKLAFRWMTAHDVGAAICIDQHWSRLTVPDPHDNTNTLTVHPGQWLIWCEVTGDIYALDDDDFRALHQPPVPPSDDMTALVEVTR